MPRGHGNIKHTIHRIEERNPNGEDTIKPWTQRVKGQIPSGYDNTCI